MASVCIIYFYVCNHLFCIFSRFPHRTTPVSTGCSAWRDSTRVMLFLFIFLALVFGAQMCADDSDVVYLTLSARIAGTCAVNILLICFLSQCLQYGEAVCTSFFLSSTVRSLSDSTDCAATLLTAAMFGKGHVTNQFSIYHLFTTVPDILLFYLVRQRQRVTVGSVT